jgi:hypothetical protein
VVDQCLVQATSAKRYFTLSYVWGKVHNPKTVKANFQQRLQRNSLALRDDFKLPRAIEDAMLLVRSISERYLWVDSLCIVQDDEEHKQRDIHRMDVVYSKSYANIVAMHGTDANGGLPGLRSRTRPSQQIETLCVSDRSPDLECKARQGPSEKILMVTTPSPLQLVLDTSVWDTRGWILQEKLLSRRCLYFSSDYVYFQCDQQTVCETALGGSGGAEFLGRRIDAPSLAKRNPLTDLKTIRNTAGDDSPRRVFAVYQKLVEMYTVRELTLESDILDAVAGILAVLGEHFDSGFVSGLPIAALDLGLLWTPAQPLYRRKCTSAPGTGKLPVHHKDPKPSFPFPSWSWAGWLGPVAYRLTDLLEAKPQIDIFYTHHLGHLKAINTRRGAKDRKAVVLPGFTKDQADQAVLRVELDQVGVSGPDLGPNVLQFWAEVVDAAAFRFSKNPPRDYLSSEDHTHVQSPQAVIRLLDRHGRHCGLWFDVSDADTIFTAGARLKRRRDMIAISRLDESTVPGRKGPSRVEGEISLFDNEEFISEGSGSGIVNVLVVEWDFDVAERCTVAQIHEQAWSEAQPRRKHIRLA